MSMNPEAQQLLQTLLEKDITGLTADEIAFLRARSGYWTVNPKYVEKFKSLLDGVELPAVSEPNQDPVETLTETVQEPEQPAAPAEEAKQPEETTEAPVTDAAVDQYDDNGASDPDTVTEPK